MNYIAFLRGINVGGNKKVSMQELKKVFEKLGFVYVRTFINSGNVLFKAENSDKRKLVVRTEEALKKKFGFEISVMIRTEPELRSILSRYPFEQVSSSDKNFTKYITFLSNTQDKKAVKEFISLFSDKEQIEIKGDNLYALIQRKDNPKPLFSNLIVEKKLNSKATTRNFNTIEKLLMLTDT